jgi:hypothetical protein
MLNKEMDILTYVVDTYKDFYTHKELFNRKFKYSQDEIDGFINKIKNEIEIKDKVISFVENKEVIRGDILALNSYDDVKKYIETLKTDSNLTKEDLLNKLSLKEWGYLYNIIYSSPIKSSMRKIDVLNSIERYFSSISRAVSMKP